MRKNLNNYKPQVAQDNIFLQKYIYNQQLSIIDCKIFKCILSKIKYNASLFEDSYTIDYSTFDTAGVPKRNRYAEVEKSLIKLMNTFVVLRENDRESIKDPELKKLKGERKLGLIQNDWIHEKNTSMISISISKILKPFFLELADKEYTIYNLENISSFGSIYELKLYELFSKWKNRGYFNITTENLREYLEVGDRYPRYANFKSRVINHIIESISKNTNLNIIYRELKKNGDIITRSGPGNKVYSLEFQIDDDEKFNPDLYVGNGFVSGDGIEYLILNVTVLEDNPKYVNLKLYNKKDGSAANLLKPLKKVDFLKFVIMD